MNADDSSGASGMTGPDPQPGSQGAYIKRVIANPAGLL